MGADEPVFLRAVDKLDPLAVQLGFQLWTRRSEAARRQLSQIDVARQMLAELAQRGRRAADRRAVNGQAHRITELLRRYRQKGWYNMPAEFLRRTARAAPHQPDGMFTRSTETLDVLAVRLGYRLWELREGDSSLRSQIDVARQIVRQAMAQQAGEPADPAQIERQAKRIVDLLKAYRVKGWYRMPEAFRAPRARPA